MSRAPAIAVAAALAAGCGDNIQVAPDAPPGPVTTGTHLVQRPAVVGGVTASGDVVFYDFDAAGHSVAKAIPIGGGDEVTIAASAGTGKPDIRFEIAGDVVFAWTDRGNRVSSLTVWSRASGVVPIGAGVRPGRAAATSDGRAIVYEQNVTTSTVDLALGPIGGTPTVVAIANAADSSCWQNTDLAVAGDRVLVRFCPASSTAFTLRSYAPDASASVDLSASAASAWYGSERVVYLEDSGALASVLADGSGKAMLATGAAEFAVSDDETTVFWRGTDGSISSIAIDGTGGPRRLVASGAMELGAISPDHATALYATMLDDRGSGFVQPYTDVKTSAGIGLVPGATSCPSCLFSSFTADSQLALVLDPIDNSDAADGEGPIHVFDLATGASVTSFGSTIYDAISIDGSRFLFLDAVRDTTQATGWRYGLTARGLHDGDPAAVIATDAEGLAVPADRSAVVYSVSASVSAEAAGVWVAPLR